MIPKLLKERSDYENSLIEVPLQNCIISKVTDREILFENLKTGETYYGQIYYQNKETSALINILMKSVLKYAGWEVNSLDDTINILNHLQGVVLINYIKYPLYLRLDKNKEIYGIISNTFVKTNKEEIYRKVYDELKKKNKFIFERTICDKYNKINLIFTNHLGPMFKIIFGNDSGHSRYNFENDKIGRYGYWDHFMPLKNLIRTIDFVLGIDYISELELTEMKNFNMN